MKEVELSDGTVLEFPESMSNDEIKSVLDRQFGNQQRTEPAQQQDQGFLRFRGRQQAAFPNAPLPGGQSPSATPFDTASTIPSDVTREPVSQIATRTGRSITQNLDIPGGMAGAVAGAKAGAPLGPIGIGTGIIAGGALGTFGGSIASDALSGKDLNFAQATEEALLSAGIDTATLGAGRVLKPAYFALRRGLGLDPRDAAQEIIRKFTPGGEGGQAGSPESIARTQTIFSEEGASLTPFQTGQGTGAQSLGDRIARVGIFSEPIIERNINEQSRIISDRMSSLFSDTVASSDQLGPEAIGDVVFSSIQQGKLALQDSYVRGLDEISSRFGRANVRRGPILNEARQFLNDKSFAGGASTELDDSSLSVVREFISELEAAPAALTVEDLFKYERRLQSQINQLSDARSSGFNSTASAQLSELSSRIRDRTLDLFEGVNPELRNRFLLLKNQYSEGLSELIPEINRNMITNASSKNMFSAIGNTMTSTGKPEQISAFYRSIDRAFAEASREGRDLPFDSANEIRDIVRQGFVAKTLPDLGPNFDLRQYRRLARYFETPSNQERARAILGEKYDPFKQLINAMSEASVKPESNIGELMVRSKEFSAITQLGGGGFLAGTAGVGGIAGAGALLASPIFLAKAATNPKNVNRIIAFDKRSFGSADALETAAINTAIDIFNDLSQEDQEEVRRSFVEQPSEPVMMGEQ